MNIINYTKAINTEYKLYIQSLRGISVLFVFLYHSNIKIFSNGYLGVDIFFVISGYVITQTIYKDYLKYHKIIIYNFFIKRAKRILPNLFFITLITYIFWLFFAPPDLSLWNETIFSILGVSNLFYLYTNRDYFNNIFESPLGHTWSLGVEVQFYLFYPLLFFFIFYFFKKKIKKFLIILLIITIISMFLSIYLQNSSPKLVFYLSPLRFWEFLFGCIAFFLNNKIKKNNIIGFIALLLIFAIIIFGNYILSFYILKNILVVIFSCLFMMYSDYKIFLNNKYLVNFGSISYSFYLWHLPIIFFMDLYIENYLIIIISSLILTILLSILTYRYIETYFRKSFTKKKIYFFGIITFIFLILIIYIMYVHVSIRKNLRSLVNQFNYLEKKHNWNNRMVFYSIKISDKKIYEYCLDNSTKFTLNDDGLKKECLKRKNNNILFFAEGDSHTAQYISALNDIELIENLYYKHSETYGVSVDLLNKISSSFNKIIYITDVNDFEKFNLIKDSIEKLNTNIEFLIFNSTPHLENAKQPFKCIVQNIDCFINKEKDMKNRNLYNLFKQLYLFKENNHSRIKVFDSYNSLCPKNLCTIYSKKDGIIFYRDDTHLVPEGAKKLVPNIILFIKNNYIF